MAAKLSWEGRVLTCDRCIYLLVLQSEINKIIIKKYEAIQGYAQLADIWSCVLRMVKTDGIKLM